MFEWDLLKHLYLTCRYEQLIHLGCLCSFYRGHALLLCDSPNHSLEVHLSIHWW